MTFKEFLRKPTKHSKKKKVKPLEWPSNISKQNFTGANNYVNTPSSGPSTQKLGGFSDTNYAGYPSS